MGVFVGAAAAGAAGAVVTEGRGGGSEKSGSCVVPPPTEGRLSIPPIKIISPLNADNFRTKVRGGIAMIHIRGDLQILHQTLVYTIKRGKCECDSSTLGQANESRQSLCRQGYRTYTCVNKGR